MSLLGKLKTALRLRAGVNALKYRLGFPSQRLALQKLASCGPSITTVIDVGAAVGDFTALALSIWPDASVLAAEPRSAALQQLRQRFEGSPKVCAMECLLAERSGMVMTLKCADTASSVLDEHLPLDVPTISIEAMSLDDVLCAQRISPKNALLKIDVQGAELSVLRGAQNTLSEARAVLVEMSLLDIHRNVPLVHEVSAWLGDQGFVMFELSDLIRRPLDNALWQIEALFVRADDPLRFNKRWQ